MLAGELMRSDLDLRSLAISGSVVLVVSGCSGDGSPSTSDRSNVPTVTTGGTKSVGGSGQSTAQQSSGGSGFLSAIGTRAGGAQGTFATTGAAVAGTGNPGTALGTEPGAAGSPLSVGGSGEGSSASLGGSNGSGVMQSGGSRMAEGGAIPATGGVSPVTGGAGVGVAEVPPGGTAATAGISGVPTTTSVSTGGSGGSVPATSTGGTSVQTSSVPDDGVDSCAPNPCLNGATCQDLPAGYKCTCGAGYGGASCEHDYCADRTCQHGGTCVRTAGAARCDCPTNYAGDSCELYQPRWQTVGAAVISGVEHPELAVDGTVPYFVYRDRSTSTGMTVRKLNGSEWVLVGSQGFSWTNSKLDTSPHIAVEGGVAYVAHEGNNITAIRNPMKSYYYAGEDWYPSTFDTYVKYSNYPDVTTVYDLAYCNQTAYLSFHDSDRDLGYTYSSANNWTQLGGTTTVYGTDTRLACEGSSLYRVMITPDAAKRERAQVQKYDAATNAWTYLVGPDFFRVESLDVLNADIAVENGNVYFLAAEGELLTDTPQPSVYRLESGAWSAVGSLRFTHEMTWMGSGAQLVLHAGTPVVGLVNHQNQPVVWYFDGTAWVQLGAPGSLLEGIAAPSPYFSIGTGTDGTVWAVLVDANSSNRAVVKRLTLI